MHGGWTRYAEYVEDGIMEHTIRATDLARNLGDVLARVRYRRDSFIVERNGKPVARVVPLAGAAGGATVAEVLTAWAHDSAGDPSLADDLAAVDASDRPPVNRWGS